jgi:hypothetical protein
MEGAARAAKRKHEADIFAAYNAAAFNGAAHHGQLQKLKKFLPKGPPPRRQSGSEMLAALREFQARGANMRISKIAT